MGLLEASPALIGVHLLIGLVTLATLLVRDGGDLTLGAAQSLDEATTRELLVVGVFTGLNATIVALIVAVWVTVAVVYTLRLDTSRHRLLLLVALPILAVFLPASVLDIGVRTGLLGGDSIAFSVDLRRLLSGVSFPGGTVLAGGSSARSLSSTSTTRIDWLAR